MHIPCVPEAPNNELACCLAYQLLTDVAPARGPVADMPSLNRVAHAHSVASTVGRLAWAAAAQLLRGAVGGVGRKPARPKRFQEFHPSGGRAPKPFSRLCMQRAPPSTHAASSTRPAAGANDRGMQPAASSSSKRPRMPLLGAWLRPYMVGKIEEGRLGQDAL